MHYDEENKEYILDITAERILKILDDKIIELDEYWGDNGVPPKWRIDMNIGSKIS